MENVVGDISELKHRVCQLKRGAQMYVLVQFPALKYQQEHHRLGVSSPSVQAWMPLCLCDSVLAHLPLDTSIRAAHDGRASTGQGRGPNTDLHIRSEQKSHEAEQGHNFRCIHMHS